MQGDSKKLEKRLVELGGSLTSPPSSVDELYELLDQIDGVLSSVEQSPSQTMLTALRPLMTALAVKDLLRHSDLDVKAVVASCISEITRITAPEAPYDDDNMKEIFQMIVETFEGLDKMASRSFQKRVSILETVAKVRSCVVMLDLECDALILEMFHNFLKTIRTYHSENVFSCMETIMTLVIEESEDISTELLSILLDTLRNDKKDVLPIAQSLAEKVMGNCAVKIKPCLLSLVRSKGAPLSEYHKVVASICQENDMLDHYGANAAFEAVADVSKLTERTSLDEPPQVPAKLEHEASCPENLDTAADNLPIAAVSNGVIQIGNADSVKRPASPKPKPEHSFCNGQVENVVSECADSDNLESTAVKPDDITDKKGKEQKINSSTQFMDMAGHSQVESHKGAPEGTSSIDCLTKETDSLEVDDTTTKEVKPAVSSEPEKKNELRHLSGSDNPTAGTSPSLGGSPSNSARPRKGRPPGSKANAKRGGVDAKADPPASKFVQKDSSVDNHTHDETMTKKVGEDERKPNDADDVKTPAGLSIESAAKPRKRRPPRSKSNAKRGDVDAKADPPASISLQKDPSVDNHAHDETMSSKVAEGEREPKDADDVKTPVSLSSDSAVKSRKGRPPGSKANVKRGDVDVVSDTPTSRSVQKGPSVENHAHDKMPTSKVDESKGEPEHADGVKMPTSLPSGSAVKSRKGRLSGSKANAKRGDDALDDARASRSVQKDSSVENHTHDEGVESENVPEDADDVETPVTLPGAAMKRSRTGQKGRFKKQAVAQESSGRKKSNTKPRKEGGVKKDVDEESNLKESSSSRSASKTSRVPSGDKAHVNDSVVPKPRRKNSMETEDISGMPPRKKEVDEGLVGSKIKVWWPDDEMFYDGLVESYDPDTKKHKIVYVDDDVEVLLLKDELWEYLEDDTEKEGGKRKSKGSASPTPRTKKPKVNPNVTSEQANSHEQLKSGPEASDKVSPRPRGRPKKGTTANLGKLSYDDSLETSKKPQESASRDKARTPRSNGKLKDVAETEPEVKTPRTSSKREESGSKSKDLTSKVSDKSKDEPSKSGKKTKGETPKAITKLKVYTSKGRGKSVDATTKESTPRAESQSKDDEVANFRIPKSGSDSKSNSVSSEGKRKHVETENEAPLSESKSTTGGKKRRTKGRK